MHLLYISVRSDMGGGPKHMLDLMSELKKTHPDCYLTVAAPDMKPFGPKFHDIADKFIEIPHRRLGFLALIKLLLHCFMHPETILHSHGRGAGLYAALLSAWVKRSVHTFHGLHYPPGLGSVVKFHVDQAICLVVDAVIAVSPDEAKHAQEISVVDTNKLYTVTNGVDYEGIQKLVRQTDRYVLRNEYKLSRETVIAGTLARLHYQKGIDLLLTALSDFFKRHPDIPLTFLVAGHGDDYSQLQQQSQALNMGSKVVWLGEVKKPIEFLAGLDIYVSFARWEGLPLSVLEAMSAGLPCLLSDTLGHQDLVVDDKKSNLFSLQDKQDFDTKLHSIIQDKVLRERFAHNLQQLAQSKYSLSQMLQKTYQVYL